MSHSRPSRSYAAELGQARANEIVRNKFRSDSETNSNGCWLFTGALIGDGYAQIWTKPTAALHSGDTGRAAWKGYLLHRVAYVARTGVEIQDQCSHLCDNRRCFNPDHIVDESALDNNNRKGCAGQILCLFHGHYLGNLCRHTPRCIRANDQHDLSCCLALKELGSGLWSTQSTSKDLDREHSSVPDIDDMASVISLDLNAMSLQSPGPLSQPSDSSNLPSQHREDTLARRLRDEIPDIYKYLTQDEPLKSPPPETPQGHRLVLKTPIRVPRSERHPIATVPGQERPLEHRRSPPSPSPARASVNLLLPRLASQAVPRRPSVLQRMRRRLSAPQLDGRRYVPPDWRHAMESIRREDDFRVQPWWRASQGHEYREGPT